MFRFDDSCAEKWASVYFFMPVFEAPPHMPALEDFCKIASRALGELSPMSEKPRMPETASSLLAFLLHDFPVHYEKDGCDIPSQIVLYGADEIDPAMFNERTVSQFWSCEDKEGFAARCKYAVMASNMMASGLPRMQRYDIIARYADALLTLFPDCIGIYWPHSQKMIPRALYEQTGWNRPEFHFLDGGLNVRFFKLADTEEMVFDTLGLCALGLPDLQLHCNALRPSDCVHFLLREAPKTAYILP